MQTANNFLTIDENGWVVRIQPPKVGQEPARVMLLIHGLNGDEKVMWIFTRNLPPHYWLIAPRGPVQSRQEGYAWVNTKTELPSLAEFSANASALLSQLDFWLERIGAPNQPFDVMGFSQGAAMAYALASFYPHRVRHVIALAGFLPREDDFPGRYSALHGKHIYIAHGRRDETIPFRMAEDAVESLDSVGAIVAFCPSDAGHKLSVSCLRGLEEFLRSNQD